MFLYVLLCCVGVVHCYGNGQVSAVCQSMTPKHAPYSVQTTTAPFTVTANKATFKEGDQITGEADSAAICFEYKLVLPHEVAVVDNLNRSV